VPIGALWCGIRVGLTTISHPGLLGGPRQRCLGGVGSDSERWNGDGMKGGSGVEARLL